MNGLILYEWEPSSSSLVLPGTLSSPLPDSRLSLPDYHYTTREAMQEGIDNGDFIENAEFSGNMYGTRYKKIQSLFYYIHI